MNTRKLFFGLFVVGVALIGRMGWKDLGAVQDAQAARTALKEELASLDAEMKKADERAATIDRDWAEGQGELSELQKQLVTTVPATAAQPVQRFGPILEMIRHDPGAEAHYLESKRADLATTYGPFFRMRGLSPEAVAKFGAVFLRREEARMDFADVLRSQDDEPSGKAVAMLEAKSDADYERDLRELLGETGFAQLQDYERTSWMRKMVSAVAGVAVLEHAPVSAQQAEALVGVIAGASKRYQQGGSAMDDDINWDAVLMQAKSILTPQQFTIMTTMDPGPSHGGLMQRRMYALVEKAKQATGKPSEPPLGVAGK